MNHQPRQRHRLIARRTHSQTNDVGEWVRARDRRRHRLIPAIILLLFALVAVSVQPHVYAGPSTVDSQTVASESMRNRSPEIPNPANKHAVSAATTSTPVPSPTPTDTPPSVVLTAKAAYAVDVTANAQLYAKNANAQLAPASTTKIITAIVTLQHVSPTAQVTIEQGDTVNWNVYSHMGLIAGDVVTVQDLLAGMLLNSGGDAALALSRYVGEQLPATSASDPRQRFVDEMNREASQLGMSKSHFVNPDGRDAPGHVSTAHDLALAAAHLFNYQLLQQLVDTRTLTVSIKGPNARDITLHNTNELLGTPGVHGVKTGTTDNAGECLIIAAWRGTDRVITVVLGSTDRYADTAKLYKYLDSEFRWVQLGRGGDLQALNTELSSKGYSLAIRKTVLLTSAQASRLRYNLTLNPVTSDSPFAAQGEVVFLIGSEPILRLSVYKGDPFAGGG